MASKRKIKTDTSSRGSRNNHKTTVAKLRQQIAKLKTRQKEREKAQKARQKERERAQKERQRAKDKAQKERQREREKAQKARQKERDRERESKQRERERKRERKRKKAEKIRAKRMAVRAKKAALKFARMQEQWVSGVSEEQTRLDGTIALKGSRLRLLPRRDVMAIHDNLANLTDEESLEQLANDYARLYNVELREVYTILYSP